LLVARDLGGWTKFLGRVLQTTCAVMPNVAQACTLHAALSPGNAKPVGYASLPVMLRKLHFAQEAL